MRAAGAWDAPPPNRIEVTKVLFDSVFFAMLLFFTLLKAALKRAGSVGRSTAASRRTLNRREVIKL